MPSMSKLRNVLACALALMATGAHAQIALTGTPVQENFDTLVATGTGTQSQLPAGWTFVESSGNTSYTATDGTANSGDTYSVGGSGSTDRAFGSIASNSNVTTLGAQFVNQTGSTIANLTISYTGEQWRNGGSGSADRLNFAISTDATALGNGTWTEVDELDFVSPVSGASAGALDGNLSANQSSISFTIPGLSIGVGQTFWIRWVDPNIPSADDLLSIDNFIASTTGSVDVPPTVSSTVPADSATGVAPATNLSVQFSEPVTTNPGWFALSCSVSGAVTVSESGSGATRTLDPVPAALVFGESCTATITAANVIDLDGTPDPMASNYQFSFTIAVDDPPAVTSTTPANGVANVPVAANILINFSEAVSTSGSWFDIQCANSGAHTAVASGGPINYTLNPDVDFELLEQCTVTLTAALILDQDGTPDPLTSNYVWSFTTAVSASNYYNGVDSSNAAVLRSTLHEVIDDHTRFAYTAGTPNTWAILNMADEDPEDTSKILDVYKNASYTKITGGQGAYNREHTWPNSLGFGNNDDGAAPNALNYPYTDTHMLYLSDTGYNSNRGNKYFGTCNAGCTEDPTVANHGQGGGSGTYPGNSNWYNGVLYEVWNARKGDMARAMFYMDIRYEGGVHGVTGAPEPDLRLTDNPSLIVNTGGNASVGYMGMLSVLLQWHIQDPVTTEEVLRNEVIYSFQGNRNPFIDHPEWVACLWQNQCTAGDAVFANGFE